MLCLTGMSYWKALTSLGHGAFLCLWINQPVVALESCVLTGILVPLGHLQGHS